MVEYHHVEQSSTFFPSLHDGPDQAHFVDRDPLEPHHVPSSDLFTLKSHRQRWMCCTPCPPVHLATILGVTRSKSLLQIQEAPRAVALALPLVGRSSQDPHHRNISSRTPSFLVPVMRTTSLNHQFLMQLVEKQV